MGENGWMPEELEAAAERVRRELIEIAVDQISKPIAHEFDIKIDLSRIADGTSILVEASSRSVQEAAVEVRVDVRPVDGHVEVERAGGPALDVDVGDADPDISEHLHHRLSDFVATSIASAIAHLNAEMQRRIGRP
jgi:hypothetical protein